jgi:isoquinoline 1-oxidoreductase alpha subunit
MAALLINGKDHTVEAEPGMPILWVLRDLLGLMGTKYGCGIGECGACTVHLGGKAVRACQVTVGEAGNREITTIEGLSDNHPVLHAFAQLSVPACGYCQPGQIMAAVALLKQNPAPKDEQIVEAISGNICRCGQYSRIVAAIRAAAGEAH